MDDIYCEYIDDAGDKSYLEILSFISVAQFSPYSVRAICKDRFGNITTPSIKQLTIISEDEYVEMRGRVT